MAKLADFVIEAKPLGSGGFGQAIRATRISDDAAVVLKRVVLSLIMFDEKLLIQARSEAEVMRRLSHRNIVEIFSSFEEEQCLYIQMEYCNSGDLSQRLEALEKEKKPIPQSLVLKWVMELSNAVKYLHASQVIHRDIKPSNVFFIGRPDNELIKLGDFGISKLRETTKTQTAGSMIMGTIEYMPPEAFDGIGSAKVDVWAMGVLLYQLMMFRLPFRGNNAMQIWKNIASANREPIPETPYSPSLRSLVDQMLTQKLDDRPAMVVIWQRCILSATESGSLELITTHLADGADVNCRSADGSNWTALMYAARDNKLKIAQLLLDNTADVNAQNMKGWTALHLAAYNAHLEITKLLVQNKAAVNLQGSDGWTPLMLATQNSYFETMKVLVDNKADVNAKSKSGRSAIHFAAFNNNLDAAALLIENGADINAQDDEGCTALLLSVKSRHFEMVELLVEKKADLNIPSKDGWTAVMHAAKNGHLLMIKLLIKNNSETKSKSKNGSTAYSIASDDYRNNIIRELRTASK